MCTWNTYLFCCWVGFYENVSWIQLVGSVKSSWWCSGKELPATAGDRVDVNLIPWSGRSPGVGNGNPLQYSYLENPMDRGAWWATVHGVPKSRTRLSD